MASLTRCRFLRTLSLALAALACTLRAEVAHRFCFALPQDAHYGRAATLLDDADTASKADFLRRYSARLSRHTRSFHRLRLTLERAAIRLVEVRGTVVKAVKADVSVSPVKIGVQGFAEHEGERPKLRLMGSIRDFCGRVEPLCAACGVADKAQTQFCGVIQLHGAMDDSQGAVRAKPWFGWLV